MIYFDTDVLVNIYINQDDTKHYQAKTLIKEINADNLGKISTLTIQEVVFVLEKLKMEKTQTKTIFNQLIVLNPLSYDTTTLKRAADLANIIGFKHINDCIHTAIAEKYCTEIITYNKKDFSKIAKLTSIKVSIL